MRAILNMYDKFPREKKWVVLGDMLEQGTGEQVEHEKLAEVIGAYDFERIILMGSRVSSYTYDRLKNLLDSRLRGNDNGESGDVVIEKFLGPRETLDYLLANLRGGETVLFKGARFMEGIIENLLLDKKDALRLVRREEIWEKRRKEWGL
jgi:UDP-N-acetylmuramyl pentapeptide synthase